MKKLIKYVMSFIAAMTFVVSAFAQMTTSALNGKVTTSDGEPAFGAAVVAIHVPSGTQYYAVVNSEGRYTINGMRSGGPYTVEVSCLGYQTVKVTEVILQLAETTAINATLKDDAQMLEQAVVISSASSKFAGVEKTGASTNISNREFSSMPTVNRSITDVVRLSPYGGDGMNFSGSSGRSANFTVDGANVNNNFGLSTSLPGGGSPISLDAIEEMQVVVSPYDVRQSNFIGGGINAITKSGTNTFKGTAYVYHQNENLHGNRINNTELAERSIDRKTTYGFSLGGPIIKDKLFFFANAEYSKIPTVANRWVLSTDGVGDADKNISRVKQSEAEQLSNFLKNQYGYDPGSYTDYPANESNMKVLARVDWNINRDNHLAVRFNYTTNTYWSLPSTSRDISAFTESAESKYGMYFSNAMYSKSDNIMTFSADLNSRLSDNLSNQLLVTYSDIEEVRGTNSSEFPFVEIAAGDIPGEFGGNSYPYMTFGYELFTLGNRVGNNVLNVKDDLTWFLGNHKVMAGVGFEYQKALNIYMRNGTGMFRFNSLSDFYAGNSPIAMAFDWGYNGETTPSAAVRFYQANLYAQDEWTVSDTFKLTYGIRFDTIIFNNNDVVTNNAVLALDYGGRNIDTGRWPTTKVQISPRIGFNWDPFGDKSLKVRGGTGLFAGRLPLVFFTNMPTNSGQVKGRLTKMTDPNVLSKFIVDGKLVSDKSQILTILNGIDPKKYPTVYDETTGSVPSEIAGVAPDFKMPQVWKSSIAVDYNIPVSFPFSITGEFIYNKTINGVMLSNYNIADNESWSTFNGADGRHMYPSSQVDGHAAYKYNKADAYVLTNTNKGYGYVASAYMKMQPVKNLDIIASYTYTVSKEVTGMPGSNASAAWQYIPSVDGPNFNNLHNSSYNSIPHRLMASVSYRDKGGNTFGLIYEGRRYSGSSYMYSNDINGDGFTYDLMYIPRDETEINFVSADDAARYWAFANQDEYLSSHKGQYAEAYGILSPWRNTFDFHYSHDFEFNIGKQKNALQLNFDIMNIGNLLNSNWGVAKTFSDGALSGRILKYEGINAQGQPTFSTRVAAGTKTWDYAHTYGNCWYMQVGIRYLFN